ncbi:DEAD/DEAH box helicase [Corynebacterium ulceribovis]|uniref:DEAD/DEAH box helicase n=1 Tax=Corynebacterium ulceribovis TaxID=487732 RepID=UPI0003A599C7|nr:DEAD/DEAH box helicase [Corynebacterium ulceribovis]
MTTFGRELLHSVVNNYPRSTLTHVRDIPGRAGSTADWPSWADPALIQGLLTTRGINQPWTHQATTAELAWQGKDVVVATGTASGKSLGYQLPVLSSMAASPTTSALYLSPTKALGADQLSSIRRLCAEIPSLSNVGVAAYDGDTPMDVRRAIRDQARWVFTNPDMLHAGILSNHENWGRLFRNLRWVVIDECHAYRGVFGAHVAMVLRRLERIARFYGAAPTFIFASATTADPAKHASRLLGREVVAVTEDGAPLGARTVALWEPELLPTSGLESVTDMPVRRAASTEVAEITADLVSEGARALVFTRARRSAETVSIGMRERLRKLGRSDLAGRVAAYRAGYLAEDRRELERRLDSGELVAVASTNALELGIDVGGLDVVVQAGFPGTVASFWQQAGRAGRRGQGALVVLIARDNPMDTYLVHHPDALLGRPVEDSVFDPTNPHVVADQLYCAVVELPLSDADVVAWGAAESMQQLAQAGLVRHRRDKWFPTDPGDDVEPNPRTAHSGVNLRGGDGQEVAIVDGTDGRVLGTVDEAAAKTSVHTGALYFHQGKSFVVDELDLETGLALVHAESPEWTTWARENTDIRVTGIQQMVEYAPGVRVAMCEVDVTQQVVDYMRRLDNGAVLDVMPLDLPPRTLTTKAVAWTMTDKRLRDWGLTGQQIPEALHAAEHAAIGLLPLFATCDRWDIGGVSTALHLDSGLPTIFVYDGHPGGAGFAQRGFDRFTDWLTATLEAVESCECTAGCPSCIQSPKCGNANSILSKEGAIKLLRGLLGKNSGIPGSIFDTQREMRTL